ncbi:hypothetical protein B0H19DRAFT_1264978 [Mycena capillaripes]|nr:hypothetical protein B0H19DRAFT_1264978 [Mycena capillaripes]
MSDMPGGYFGNDQSYPPNISMHDSWPAPDASQGNLQLALGISASGDDIAMEGENTQNVWASEQDERPQHVTHAKRVAIANPGRNEIADANAVAEAARERAKMQIAAMESQQQRLADQMMSRDNQWEQQRQLWVTQWNQFKGELDINFQQKLEEQRVANLNHMKVQMEAQIAEREAELQLHVAEIEEKSRREQEEWQLEKEKQQAEYETGLAAFHARFSFHNQGQNLQNDGTEALRFPQAPPRALRNLSRKRLGKIAESRQSYVGDLSAYPGSP